jgi:hypothetical protein
VADPKNSAVNTTKLIVPSALIRPTTSLASVMRPWASSPAVTANSRMTRRPPAPAAMIPAPIPAATARFTSQTNRRTTNWTGGGSSGPAPSGAGTCGGWTVRPPQRAVATSPASTARMQTPMTATRAV